MTASEGRADVTDTAPGGSPLEPIRRALVGRISGPVVRVLGVVAGVPLFVTLFFEHDPPLGVYLNGMVIGSLYALLGAGLILIYRSNRIISFAQAELGAIPALTGLLMYRVWEVNYFLVLGVVVGGALVLGAVVEFTIIRRFRRSPRLILTVATIGVAQLLAFFEIFLPRWIRLDGSSFGEGFVVLVRSPLGKYGTDIYGVRFTLDHLMVVLVVAALAFGLGIFLKRSVFGLAARASAENLDRASLLGIPVGRVTTIVWMIAALFSAIGVFGRVQLGGSTFGGGLGPSVLLTGLTVAVVARMDSLPVAFVAGLALGALDQGLLYATRNDTITTVVQLFVILAVLLAQRSKLSRAQDTGVATWQAVKQFRPIPRELRHEGPVIAWRYGMLAALSAALVVLPHVVGYRQSLASVGVIYAITGISMVILTGWAGQISLGQFAFVGIGAAVAGGLVTNLHWNFFLVLALAGLAGALVAVVVGLPALRLEGLYLAVTTLGFAAVTYVYVLNPNYLGWLLPETAEVVERPVLYGRFDLDSDNTFYYVCLITLLLVIVCIKGLRSSQAGRVLLASRDNGRAAESYGINLARTKLASFAISGFVAALAGALFAYLQRAVDSVVFTPQASIDIFTMAVIGGLTSIPGALAGAAYVTVFRYFLPDYSLLATGAGMLFLLLFFPGGLSEVGYRLRDAFLRSVAIKRGIHVPSLLADDLQSDAAAADAELFATTNGSGPALGEETLHCPVCDDLVPLSAAPQHPHFVEQPSIACPVCGVRLRLDEAGTHEHLAPAAEVTA